MRLDSTAGPKRGDRDVAACSPPIHSVRRPVTGSLLRIIREAEASPEVLAQAWRDQPSFVLLPDRVPLTPEAIGAALDQIPEALHEGHYVLLTSGSTGAPKFVVGSKARTTALATELHRAQGLDGVRETLVALPLTYSYAFVNQLVWAATYERIVRATPGLSDVPALLDALAGAQDAMLCLTGAQLPLLLPAIAGRSFPGIVRLNFAGGRFPQEQLPALATTFPNAAIFNNYGCAEALPRLTVRAAADGTASSDIGGPLPGIELRLSDEQVLEFRSPYQAVGIVEAGQFRRIADDDWTSTGDLAAHDDTGHWSIVGRRSEVFKRYGEKISLPTILGAVHEHWKGEAGFFVETDRQGEAAHVLVLAPTPTPDQVKGILRGLRTGFSRAMWPVRILGAAALPRLPNGKLDSAAMRTIPDATELWRQYL
jgi:acyl-CoA synthetase (AMP-forming)/AMP-acid ligase II